MNSFSDTVFINGEATACINEEAVSTMIVPRNLPSLIFISCFTFSIASSINIPQFSSDFTILVISFISSFKINKVNPFPALMVLR